MKYHEKRKKAIELIQGVFPSVDPQSVKPVKNRPITCVIYWAGVIDTRLFESLRVAFNAESVNITDVYTYPDFYYDSEISLEIVNAQIFVPNRMLL